MMAPPKKAMVTFCQISVSSRNLVYCFTQIFGATEVRKSSPKARLARSNLFLLPPGPSTASCCEFFLPVKPPRAAPAKLHNLKPYPSSHCLSLRPPPAPSLPPCFFASPAPVAGPFLATRHPPIVTVYPGLRGAVILPHAVAREHPAEL